MTKADQTAADVLTIAVESGIGYWCLVTDVQRDADRKVVVVTVHEIVPDPDKEPVATITTGGPFPEFYKRDGVRITLTEIKQAIREITYGQVQLHAARRAIVADLLRNGSDGTDCSAGAADDIVQVAVLGQPIYS
jgi:hypothetical protein